MTGMVGQPAGFLQRTVKMSAALTVPGGAACAGRPVQAGLCRPAGMARGM
jgi:hypothetical protein